MQPNTKERRTKQQLLLPPQPYPWLLYFNSNEKKNQTFCSLSDPTKSYSRSIPELGEANLRTVQHGWCLLEAKIENASKLFLWNPSSLTKINLPPFTHKSIGDIILSSSPTATNQDCCLFLFSADSTIIFYYQLGDKQWTEVDYREELVSVIAPKGKTLKEEVIYIRNPAYCNGCLYAEACSRSFLVVIEKIQPRGLKIKSAPVFIPALPLTNFDSTCKLIESDNELFRIELLHAQGKVIFVVVHKFDFSQIKWEKVESIKDRVFFVSNNLDLPFACQAINPEMEGGRIYFSLKDNNFIYIYNIEDNSFMISQPLPNNLSSSWWFMPDLRMTSSLKEESGKTQISRTDIYSKEMDTIFRNTKKQKMATNAFALPLEMVEKIAERLNVIDYLHFRATSRLLCAAAPPIQWRSSPSMPMSRLSSSPLFVFFEKDKVLTMTHPKHGLKYKYSMNFPKDFHYLPKDFQENCEICYSKDGWLLMAIKEFCNVFFNPFTKEVKLTACGPSPNRNTRCVGFSHPPTSCACVVVECKKQFSTMVASIIYPGNREWGYFNFEDNNFPLYNTSPTYHKGDFYFMSEKGKLGVLNVREEGASWQALEKLHAPCTDYYNSFLVVCNDNLLSVFEGHFGKWVQIFMLNESEMTWTRVESIENYMLFVGNMSLSAVADIPGMENKIYFPRFYDQNIVFYSLETNKYHTFNNEVVNFHYVREQLNNGWIEPRWH